jgi:hypothetical protein
MPDGGTVHALIDRDDATGHRPRIAACSLDIRLRVSRWSQRTLVERSAAQSQRYTVLAIALIETQRETKNFMAQINRLNTG